MLRNERVAAKLTQHSFAKRRSVPKKPDSMQQLDNLIYIVKQNEYEYEQYLGQRMRNMEIEKTILQVKKK